MIVNDVMLSFDHFPVLNESAILKVCLEQMSHSRLGIATVVSDSGHLLGIFTDGDLRRVLLRIQKPLAALFVDDVLDHGTLDPLTVTSSDSLDSAFELMKRYQVWDLPVVDGTNKLVGLLHLHPAVEALLNS